MELKSLKKTVTAGIVYLSACAALQAGLSVEPQIVELMIPVSQPHSQSYEVTNNSEQEIQVSVESENWLKLRGIDTENASIPVSQWFNISPSRFTLAPGESKEIYYTIELPPELEGELVVMNFFAIEGPEDGITLRRRFGFPLYAAAQDSSSISCEISEEIISGDRLNLKIKNTGNVHLRPEVYVMIVDENEDTAKKIELTGRTPVFPGRSESFSARGEDKLPPGRYIAQPLVRYGMVFEKNCSIRGEAFELLIAE